MDRIMPIDLERAQLKKSLRGYAVREVDPLLRAASESLQTAVVEVDQLKQELDRTRSELETMRSLERTLRDALVLAQQAADETRASAHRQAEAILEEARQTVATERNEHLQRLAEIRWESDRIRLEKQRFYDDFRSTLDRYLREISPAPLTVVKGDVAATGS